MTYHNYRQWMLQQKQRKDEVLAFEMKEPCTPLGQKVSGSDCELQAQSLESNGKKSYNNFFVCSNTIDNILHGENEVRM